MLCYYYVTMLLCYYYVIVLLCYYVIIMLLNICDVDFKDLFIFFVLNFLPLQLEAKHISCHPKDQKVSQGVKFLVEVDRVPQVTALSLPV